MAPTTTSLNAFPVPGLSLIIRDTWGTTSAVDCSQLTAVFPLLVEGCLPSGWKLNDEPMEAVLKVGKSSRFRRRAHAVMFCITASLLSDGKADKDIECIRNLCVQVCFALMHIVTCFSVCFAVQGHTLLVVLK